ncbi:MAG: hypothetical protein AAGE80_07760 [Pseudomonadota bacterium]
MDLIADGLLVLAALAASLYCWVLSRRLRRLTQLDKGLGAAISSLSEQVEEMQTALAQSKEAIETRTTLLSNLTTEADKAAKRLEVALKAAPASVPEPAPRANVPESPSAIEAAFEPQDAVMVPDEEILDLNDADPALVPVIDEEEVDAGLLRVDRLDSEPDRAAGAQKNDEGQAEDADADAIASLLSLTKASSGGGAGALDRLLKALKRDMQEQRP